MSTLRPRLLVDENVPRQAVRALVDLGYDVLWAARDPSLRGAKNSVLLHPAVASGSVLVTCDSDFLATHARWKIVYLRPLNDPGRQARVVRRHIEQAMGLLEEGEASIVVLDEDGVNIVA